MKTLIIDFDNTFADASSRIVDYFNDYRPMSQNTYSYKNKAMLELYGEKEFYNKKLLKPNLEVLDFIKEICLKSETLVKIVFISSCFNEEVATEKKNFILQFQDYFKNAYIDCSNIREGIVNLEEVISEQNRLYIVIDDFRDRLAEAVSLSDNFNIRIAPVLHPYNINFITENKDKFIYLISPNYLKLSLENCTELRSI